MAYIPPHKRCAAAADVPHKRKGNATVDTRAVFREVVSDVRLATHCHGCGKAGAVTLLGYVGQYCGKSCWSEHDSCGDDRGHHNCKICNSVFVSCVTSRCHIPYRNSLSPTRFVWPMSGPTTNECIRMRPTTRIHGYNC